MGFRFRKSINLGGGFRINLSKTGIGYSFGMPGLRFTKLANGRTRHTYSLPGTGLSYVEESKGDGSYSENKEYQFDEHNELEYSSSIDVSEDSFNDFVNLMNKLRSRDRIYKCILILSIIPALLFTPLLFIAPITVICFRFLYKDLFNIDNNYDFLIYANERYAILNLFLYIMSLNEKISLVENQYSTNNYKYHSGANSLIDTKNADLRPKFLRYIKLDYAPYALTIKNKTFYFLPNLVLVDDNHKYSKLDYSDLKCEVGKCSCVEEKVPKDATIVDYTWRYTNKDGSQDRRFNDNYQIAICNYCEVHCFNNKGFDITLNLSNLNTAMNLTGLCKILQEKEYFENPEKLETVQKIIDSVINGVCCPICGDDNIINKICSKCGYHLNSYYDYRQNTTEGNNHWGKTILWILIIIFACAFINNSSIVFNNATEKPTNVQTTERYVKKSLPSKYLADEQKPNSEFIYTLRWDLFNLYKFQKLSPYERVNKFENFDGLYTMSDLIFGFVDRNQQYKIAENYCIKYNNTEREYPILEKVVCNNPKSILELPYSKCEWFTIKDNDGLHYASYDIESLWHEFKTKGVNKIEQEIEMEISAYLSKKISDELIKQNNIIKQEESIFYSNVNSSSNNDILFNKLYNKYLDAINILNLTGYYDNKDLSVYYHNNWVKLISSEGSYYYGINYNYLINKYGQYLSKEYKEWLKHLSETEHLVEDACLNVKPDKLREYIVYLEDSITKNPDFLLNNDIRDRIKSYLSIYLEGMDNSPVFDTWNTKRINTDFKSSYEKFLTENTNSKYYPMVEELYNKAKENNFMWDENFHDWHMNNFHKKYFTE